VLVRAWLLVASAVVLVGCASAGKNRRCVPIDPDLYMDYGGLYDECTVETRARLSFTPRIDYPYAAPLNVYCLYGTLRFIVDTLGNPLGQTVQVLAGNDERYVEQMVSYLPQIRYAPGQVKGRPVHQIVTWESRMPVRQTTTPSRTATTRNASC
jgi:hypothetical protein